MPLSPKKKNSRANKQSPKGAGTMIVMTTELNRGGPATTAPTKSIIIVIVTATITINTIVNTVRQRRSQNTNVIPIHLLYLRNKVKWEAILTRSSGPIEEGAFWSPLWNRAPLLSWIPNGCATTTTTSKNATRTSAVPQQQQQQQQYRCPDDKIYHAKPFVHCTKFNNAPNDFTWASFSCRIRGCIELIRILAGIPCRWWSRPWNKG
mmetsp:Transcript_19592/g.53958  ORF Transcript_19592/g.53958 Transcript_19592/m.53958 type:complete len:207 (-) Transcript_19592:1189-1809(-)